MSVLTRLFPHWLGKMKTLPSLKYSLNHSARACPAAPIAMALFFAITIAARATTITVTNTNDSGPGSLRAALAAANDFDAIDATGVSGTILLTSGPLEVTRNVTILGPGPANLAVNGNATNRVFEVHGSPFTNGDVVISGLTITNGVGNFNNGTDG